MHVDGFFYKAKAEAVVDALIEKKDFSMLRACFNHLFNPDAVVTVRVPGGGKIYIPNIANGLPVGHPYSCFLASLPMSLAFTKALKKCTSGDPSALLRFEKRLFVKAFVDDFHLCGAFSCVVAILREFVPLIMDSGAGQFKDGKGFVSLLSEGTHDLSESDLGRLIWWLCSARVVSKRLILRVMADPIRGVGVHGVVYPLHPRCKSLFLSLKVGKVISALGLFLALTPICLARQSRLRIW